MNRQPIAMRKLAAFVVLLAAPACLHADPPGLSYLFPAGGQRGTTVTIRAGGLYLHDRCGFMLLGPGVKADSQLKRTQTIYFEGPILPLPDSQRQENYPQDMLGTIRIDANAPLGKRNAVAWTAEGGASGPVFVVGDLPEIVENEKPGDVMAEPVNAPVTINGRIYPREDVDEWSVALKKGETLTATAVAEKIGTPLSVRLEAVDASGRQLAESTDAAGSVDAQLRFAAPADGTYRIRIYDARYQGGPEYVYRLTLTAGPLVDAVFPLGGRRGTTTELELIGANVPQRAAISMPADARAEYFHAFSFAGKNTPPIRIDVDDLPELVESQSNASQRIQAPVIANGRIETAGEVDRWPVQLAKGKTYELDLRARRLDSPLHGVLTVMDDKGKEIARSDALDQNLADPKLTFSPPADGIYQICVADRFRARGGKRFAYRLRVTESAAAAPDFRVNLKSEIITVERGKSASVKVECARTGGFAGPVELRPVGLPAGITLKPVTIAAKDRNAEIKFEASAEALLRGTPIRLEAMAEIGARKVIKPVTVEPVNHQAPFEDLLLVVSIKTPFVLKSDYLLSQAPRGTVFRKRYRIERNGYDGPLEVRLADRQARHLQGVTGPLLTIPATQNEFEYPIFMPPWMEIGRTCRVCVMGTGRIRDRDGTEHQVSYSSVEPHMQIIVVIEPGKLGVELDRSSLAALPGAGTEIDVKVSRGPGLAGPVKVEIICPEHWQGVVAKPVTIVADQASGRLSLQFAKDARGPFMSPVIVRATLLERGDPVVGESKLEIVAK